MDLTLLFPAYNRAHLFAPTIKSLLMQHGRDQLEWEILVIDDGSTDNLMEVLESSVQHGLPIRCIRIDVTRHDKPVFQYKGANNPAPALNVGIKQAKSDRIVISSPEVTYLYADNLLRLANTPMPRGTALVCDVWDEKMQRWIGGGGAVRPLHFLNVYWRADLEAVGGFEEDFVLGRGWEDTEFVGRWLRTGRTFQRIMPPLVGHHRDHPRPEVEEREYASYEANKELYLDLMRDGTRIMANTGRCWGTDVLVERVWPPISPS